MTESIVEHLEKAPLTRFHYGLLLLGSLIYGFTAMNVLLIAAVLTPIINEFGLKQQSLISGLLLSMCYLGMFVNQKAWQNRDFAKSTPRSRYSIRHRSSTVLNHSGNCLHGHSKSL